MRVLQSKIKETWYKLLLYSSATQPNTILTSNSISTTSKFKFVYIINPFLRAYSSASTLIEIPIDQVKSFIQAPLWSRIRPPLLVKPKLPKEDPSVFNFNPSNFRFIPPLISLVRAVQNINSLATTQISLHRNKVVFKNSPLNRELWFVCIRC